MPSSYLNDIADAPVLVWFRNDLRLDDNSALIAACETGKPVICLFIHEDDVGSGTIGGAQRWWLNHSLKAFGDGLEKLGAKLILRSGKTRDVLESILEESGAGTIVWNRRYAPEEIELDTQIKSWLNDDGYKAASFDGRLMHEPSTQIRTGDGNPYKVFTPFWRAFQKREDVRDPQDAPDAINAHDGDLKSEDLAGWNLLPTSPDWSGGIAEQWTPGEVGAHERLSTFLEENADRYDEARDLPADDATSRLSPHLAFGEISPFRIWRETNAKPGPRSDARTTFLQELVWREFSYHLLVNTDDMTNKNYNSDFDAFPWRDDEDALKRWQKGQTGYPIVDAGMRQLWQTGWMHNRVRMIVGSFLVKHLLLDWRHGERWFRDTLVDCDPASNVAGWQWVAGSGADAAPYFRIFNPILQGEKFDKDGDYVKLFVPELVDLPAKYIHKPWDAPTSTLKKAGITLGETYPKPIVDHKQARERALSAYQTMREEAA